jgi:fermentation-respiration switch protein FrsA (DUF1100 family)
VEDTYSPERSYDRISPTPLLVIHGDRDRVCSSRFGEQIYSAALEPKQIWRIPGGEHIDAMVRHEGKYRTQLLDYLAQLRSTKKK